MKQFIDEFYFEIPPDFTKFCTDHPDYDDDLSFSYSFNFCIDQDPVQTLKESILADINLKDVNPGRIVCGTFDNDVITSSYKPNMPSLQAHAFFNIHFDTESDNQYENTSEEAYDPSNISDSTLFPVWTRKFKQSYLDFKHFVLTDGSK